MWLAKLAHIEYQLNRAKQGIGTHSMDTPAASWHWSIGIITVNLTHKRKLAHAYFSSPLESFKHDTFNTHQINGQLELNLDLRLLEGWPESQNWWAKHVYMQSSDGTYLPRSQASQLHSAATRSEWSWEAKPGNEARYLQLLH